MPGGGSASVIDFSALETPTDGTPAWLTVPGQIRQGDLGSGGMRLDIPASSGAFRIRVREVERVGTEIEAPAPQTTTLGELLERVVFADVVPFPDA